MSISINVEVTYGCQSKDRSRPTRVCLGQLLGDVHLGIFSYTISVNVFDIENAPIDISLSLLGLGTGVPPILCLLAKLVDPSRLELC